MTNPTISWNIAKPVRKRHSSHRELKRKGSALHPKGECTSSSDPRVLSRWKEEPEGLQCRRRMLKGADGECRKGQTGNAERGRRGMPRGADAQRRERSGARRRPPAPERSPGPPHPPFPHQLPPARDVAGCSWIRSDATGLKSV